MKQQLSYFDKFKNQVTRSTIEIEQKGKDRYTVDNVGNYSISSNHDGVKIESKDRRYYCIESSNKYVGNKIYFDWIIDTCFNQECGNLFYTYLRSVFVPIPLHPIQVTDYKLELINNGLPKHLVFLNDVFTKEYIPLPPSLFHWCNKENKWYFSRMELYERYKEWVGPKHSYVSNAIFGTAILATDGIIGNFRKRLNGTIENNLTSSKVNNQHGCSYLREDLYDTTMIKGINEPNYPLSVLKFKQSKGYYIF